MTRMLGSLGLALALLAPPSASGQRGGANTGKMSIPVQKSGKVLMEDGTPPPESVIVEASCGGSYSPVARTDSKGGFIIGRGRDADVDARLQRGSVAGGVTTGCWLVARLPGYQSSPLRIANAEAFDLGVITLRRPAGVEGTAYSATATRAPKAAQKAMEKAAAAIQKKKWDEARPNLLKAVELYPEHATAWMEIGRMHDASGNLAEARGAYERAIQADPKFVRPYILLAGVWHREKNWRAMADTSAAAVKLDPYSYVAAHLMHAISNLRLGNSQAAEASAVQAVKLDTEHAFPEAEYTLGILLEARGDAKGAAEHLRNFLQFAPNSPGAPAVKQRVAELEKTAPPPPAQ